MLHVLADESDNQGLKMNKSKTKVMMETYSPIYVNDIQIENDESYIYLDRDTEPATQSKTKRFKEELRPDGQHSPSTAKYSRVRLEHA